MPPSNVRRFGVSNSMIAQAPNMKGSAQAPSRRRPFRTRLFLLAGAIGVTAGLNVWAVWNSGHRVQDLQHRLTAAHLARFRLADEFQRRLLALNNSMLRFTVRHDPAVWSQFEQASRELDRWLDERSPQLSSDRERELFRQLNAAYDDYMQAAQRVRDSRQPAAGSGELLPEIRAFESKAEELLTLGQRLASAHGEARESFLGEANAQIQRLRLLLFGSAGLSLALMIALGWFVYRDLIAPLRTRLVQSEAILARQEKLATLGTLAAGIAHEIRNPLTSINARLYTLRKHLKANSPAQTDADTIAREIARLERIVQDVLSFARPSEPRKSVAPVDALLREVHALMAVALERRGVRLTLEAADGLYVAMDVALIKQVLINLVRNAAEAIAGEGVVVLRCRPDRATLGGTECAVAILEVEDTGRGIPPEVEARLFDPFFTTKEAGTGLGLSIAARIVEKHGGVLQYQTRVGHGTTFGVVLPRASNPVAPTPTEVGAKVI